MVSFTIKNKFGNRLVGDDWYNPCFLIAEVGVNHNGDVEQAHKMISILSDLDIDAIKFQTYITEDLVDKNDDSYEMLKKYELPLKMFKNLAQHVEDEGLIFLSTPFDIKSVKFLRKIVPAYKISSGDINNFRLLKEVALTKKPIILSTGICIEKEIKMAVDFLHEQETFLDIAILQCTTQYPTVDREVNLNVIDLYKRLYPECVIGFSDHSIGHTASLGAIGKGAKIIERHFTIDKNQDGPDHKASSDFKEMEEWVKNIRKLETQLGLTTKCPSLYEIDIRNKVRKGIFVVKKIKKGELFSEKNLSTKRPVLGVSTVHYYKVVGRKAKRNILKNSFLQWDDVVMYDGDK